MNFFTPASVRSSSGPTLCTSASCDSVCAALIQSISGRPADQAVRQYNVLRGRLLRARAVFPNLSGFDRETQDVTLGLEPAKRLVLPRHATRRDQGVLQRRHASERAERLRPPEPPLASGPVACPDG